MVAKNKKTKTARNRYSYILPLLIGCILVVAVISFGIFAGKNYFSKSSKPEEVEIGNINTADVSAAADPVETNDHPETTQGNEAKRRAAEAEEEQNKEVETDNNGLKKATVVLNEPYRAGDNLIISSVITNVVEREGRCRYVFTNNGKTVTKFTNVLPNAKNTVCEAVVLERGSLDAGQWNVRLEYKSKISEGTSETKTFTFK